MKELFPLHGVVTTVLTPFNDDLSIDMESFRRSINAALDAGVVGFLCPCSAGEIKYLTFEERKEMVGEAVNITKGKAMVISNIAAENREDRIKMCKDYLELGVSGLNLNMPYTTDDEYRKMVADIDALKPPFMCIQDDTNKGHDIPVELIKSLFYEFETLRCIKIEVKYSGPKYTKVLQATDGMLNVSGAWGSDQMIEAFDRGIHALMPSGLYELFVNIYDLYHKKSREAAIKLFFDMLPIILFTRQSNSVNRTFHKMYLQRLGIFKTTISREPTYFDEYHERCANELIDRAIELKKRLPEYWM